MLAFLSTGTFGLLDNIDTPIRWTAVQSLDIRYRLVSPMPLVFSLT